MAHLQPPLQFAAVGVPARGYTVLSTVAHSLLPWFTTRDVLPLRGTCQEARDAVARHPWDDCTKLVAAEPLAHLREGTRITGSLASWRLCFPGAVGANLRGAKELTDAQVLQHLVGLRSLDISGCSALTDASIAGVAPTLHTLLMCGLELITDAALVHVTHARTLDVSGCKRITSAGLLACPALASRTLSRIRIRDCPDIPRDVIARIRDAGAADIPMLWVLTHGGWGRAWGGTCAFACFMTHRAARREIRRLAGEWDNAVRTMPSRVGADYFAADDEVDVNGEDYGCEISLQTNHGYQCAWNFDAIDEPQVGCGAPITVPEPGEEVIADDSEYDE